MTSTTKHPPQAKHAGIYGLNGPQFGSTQEMLCFDTFSLL